MDTVRPSQRQEWAQEGHLQCLGRRAQGGTGALHSEGWAQEGASLLRVRGRGGLLVRDEAQPVDLQREDGGGQLLPGRGRDVLLADAALERRTPRAREKCSGDAPDPDPPEGSAARGRAPPLPHSPPAARGQPGNKLKVWYWHTRAAGLMCVAPMAHPRTGTPQMRKKDPSKAAPCGTWQGSRSGVSLSKGAPVGGRGHTQVGTVLKRGDPLQTFVRG